MVKQKSYRELQAELDGVLEELQSAELDIDKAMGLYKTGQKLIKEAEDYLQNAKNEIEHLKKL
ncbi:MAG TPA: exodeoxyribonuclease VII small subunit [Candidatus Limnocylindrales bacterium]|nr:exodeoxyribonuclease VII small subunit [Candidatus Limnocylindrales bacterium]